MPTEALRVTDDDSARIATHPRVTLDGMVAKIQSENYIVPEFAPILTICVLTMKNGFFVTGESAPASPENFDAARGRLLSYENAIRKLWALEAYALRDQLSLPLEERADV